MPVNHLPFSCHPSTSCHFLFCVQHSIWVADLKLWRKAPHHNNISSTYNQLHIWEMIWFLIIWLHQSKSWATEKNNILRTTALCSNPILMAQQSITWRLLTVTTAFHIQRKRNADIFLWCVWLQHIISSKATTKRRKRRAGKDVRGWLRGREAEATIIS